MVPYRTIAQNIIALLQTWKNSTFYQVCDFSSSWIWIYSNLDSVTVPTYVLHSPTRLYMYIERCSLYHTFILYYNRLL